MNNASEKGTEDYKCPEILKNSVERATIRFMHCELEDYKPKLPLFLAK